MESITQDLRLLSESCSLFSLSFIRRSCNIVAYHVAKYGCGSALGFSCVSFSSFVLRLADVDFNVFYLKFDGLFWHFQKKKYHQHRKWL